MEPGRRIARHHQPVGVETEGGDEGGGIGLRIEETGILRAAPVPAGAAEARQPRPDSGGGEILLLRPDAAIGLADLEEADIGLAAI